VASIISSCLQTSHACESSVHRCTHAVAALVSKRAQCEISCCVASSSQGAGSQGWKAAPASCNEPWCLHSTRDARYYQSKQQKRCRQLRCASNTTWCPLQAHEVQMATVWMQHARCKQLFCASRTQGASSTQGTQHVCAGSTQQQCTTSTDRNQAAMVCKQHTRCKQVWCPTSTQQQHHNSFIETANKECKPTRCNQMCSGIRAAHKVQAASSIQGASNCEMQAAYNVQAAAACKRITRYMQVM
jgi:hypothetical protein